MTVRVNKENKEKERKEIFHEPSFWIVGKPAFEKTNDQEKKMKRSIPRVSLLVLLEQLKTLIPSFLQKSKLCEVIKGSIKQHLNDWLQEIIYTIA